MGEFDHPGVFFFDPQDPATVDLAWQRLQATKPVTIPQARLDDLYNWDLVARALLDAHARNRAEVAAVRRRSQRPGFSDDSAGQAGGGPLHPAVPGPEQAASPRVKQDAGMRIGIELFGTQGDSRHRGIGRYSRNLVATLLARDPANDYVLYGQDGLATDQIPTAPNAVVRLLRPDSARGETTLAHAMERLTETNPDGLDVLLLLHPLEMAQGYALPAKPLNGLKMVAVVHDLIPLLFQEEYFSLWPGPEFVRRYVQGLNRLRSYDALLANSEATRRDFVSSLGLSPDRVVTIGAASDGRFFVPDRTDPMPAESRAVAGTRDHSAVRLLRGLTGVPEEPVGADRGLHDAAGRVAAGASVGPDLCPVGAGQRPGATVRPGPRCRRSVGGDRPALGQGVAGLVSTMRGVRLPLVV